MLYSTIEEASEAIAGQEQERRRCEVRQFLSWKARRKAKHIADAMAIIKRQRGIEAYEALRRECADQWSKGNRGGLGVWIE